MAHSKNDVPFFGGTLRQRTNTKKGIPTVECALIDPNTTCPYTNAELYRALFREMESHGMSGIKMSFGRTRIDTLC